MQRTTGIRQVFITVFFFLSISSYSQTYTMGNTTENTCSGMFYDSGGPGGAYGNNANQTMTFCSCNNTRLRIRFSMLNIESCCDDLYIYDGPNTSSPLIGNYTGTALPPEVNSTGGCVTFRFTSDGSVANAGWAASIQCIPTPAVMASGPTTFCDGDSVILTAPSGTAYNWSNNATTQSITVKTAGSYTVQVTDANSCKNTSDPTAVTVLFIPATPGTITGQSPTCANSAQNYSIAAVSGATNYTWTVPSGFVLNSGQGTTTINTKVDTIGGDISVTASNVCGTSAPKTKSITVVFPLPAPGPINGPSVICTGDTVTYTIPPIPTATTYTWTVPAGCLLSSGQGTNSIKVVGIALSGNITVTATNACGTTPATSIAVSVGSVPPAGSGTISGPATACANSVQTYVTTAVTGATQYNWSFPAGSTILSGQGSDTVQVRFGSTSGTITMTPTNGCDGTASTLNVTLNPAPTADAGTDATICLGDSCTLTAAGGTTYLWSPATGLGNVNTVSVKASPSETTTYTVLVTNAAGCTDEDTVIVNVNPLPVADAGMDTTICEDGDALLQASGGSTYSWSPGTGLDDAGIANPTASPTSDITYTVTVTDGNGCNDTDEVQVMVQALPAADAGQDQSVCEGGSLTLTASGGTTYAWSTGDNTASIVITPVAPAFYAVTVIDALGCVAADSAFVTVNPLPVVNAGPDLSICQGSSTTLTGSGNGSPSWTPTTGLSDAATLNPAASPLASTQYILKLTNSFGCSAEDTMELTVLPAPFPVIAGELSICYGETVVLTAAGGSAYQWNTGDTTEQITVSPLSTSTYAVTVSLGECTASAMHTIAVDTVNAYAGEDTLICVDHSAQLNASGGTAYHWTPEESLSDAFISNPVATPASTTTYVVEVSDDSGCTDTDTVVVTVDPCIGIAEVLGNNVKISPNPTKRLLAVELQEKLSSIRMFNAQGLQVPVKISKGSSASSCILDLDGLAPGVYFLQVELHQGAVSKKVLLE